MLRSKKLDRSESITRRHEGHCVTRAWRIVCAKIREHYCERRRPSCYRGLRTLQVPQGAGVLAVHVMNIIHMRLEAERNTDTKGHEHTQLRPRWPAYKQTDPSLARAGNEASHTSPACIELWTPHKPHMSQAWMGGQPTPNAFYMSQACMRDQATPSAVRLVTAATPCWNPDVLSSTTNMSFASSGINIEPSSRCSSRCTTYWGPMALPRRKPACDTHTHTHTHR